MRQVPTQNEGVGENEETKKESSFANGNNQPRKHLHGHSDHTVEIIVNCTCGQ